MTVETAPKSVESVPNRFLAENTQPVPTGSLATPLNHAHFNQFQNRFLTGSLISPDNQFHPVLPLYK